MSVFLPDRPTARKVPTWAWWRAFTRSFASVVNRLTPANFTGAPGFGISKRARHYADYDVSYSQEHAQFALMPLGDPVIAFFRVRNPGSLTAIRLECSAMDAFAAGDDITVTAYINGAAVVGSAVTIDNATDDDNNAITAANGAIIATNLVEMRITNRPLPPLGGPFYPVHWTATLSVREQLSI